MFDPYIKTKSLALGTLEPVRPAKSRISLHSCASAKNFRLRSVGNRWLGGSGRGQRRLRSDYTSVQSDLCLRWAHMSGDTLSHAVTHVTMTITFVQTG